MASRLAEMQARFQQKQMQEREEKLLKLYESQQQRAFDRVGRGSAGSNTSIGSTAGGKVRQMFEERRRAGIDKSYPLDPINGKTMTRISNGKQPVITNSRRTVQATVQRSVTHIRNGKPLINKREAVQKIYDNNNGVEKYQTNHFNENLLDDTDTLVDLMNRNNIYDDLDNEESPPLEALEDDVSFMGKLANVGGVPPSQNTITNVTSSPKKDVKPLAFEPKRSSPAKIVRKSVHKSETLSRKSNSSSQPESRSGSSTYNSSPVHSITKMATSTKPNAASSQRSPSTNRPSSKQTSPRVATSAVVRDDLQECSSCGRRFATDRIHKHEEICGKTAKKNRKVYDAFKHRVQGTEIEQFVGGGKKKGAKAVQKKTPAVSAAQSKKNWRRTHEEFIAAIRSAKMMQAHLAKGGKLSDLPPPPPSTNPDYVQCPSCGRRFNEAAAQRHIPKCANYQFNKPKAAKKR